ncbi:hypothetical protein VNI00_007159 [Paramarasmius palmivorus]|uniref:Uncharacterized protein n=1 Tax=Paramarasmius palmivorus TaxID=297713 RepID=A0AAW0D477_9AGAR
MEFFRNRFASNKFWSFVDYELEGSRQGALKAAGGDRQKAERIQKFMTKTLQNHLKTRKPIAYVNLNRSVAERALDANKAPQWQVKLEAAMAFTSATPYESFVYSSDGED